MKLPVDEEDDEQMVGIPKALKVGPASLFHRVPDNKHQADEHYPAGDPRPSCEVHQQEVDKDILGRGRRYHGKLHKVVHMGRYVNHSPKDNGPGGSLVERDILVERDDIVQGCSAQQGDEVPAHRE